MDHEEGEAIVQLGLVHIHRDFEVDMYKALEVFVSAKTRRADFGQLRNSCLSVF